MLTEVTKGFLVETVFLIILIPITDLFSTENRKEKQRFTCLLRKKSCAEIT